MHSALVLIPDDGSINTIQLGNVLRALGYNPTAGEVVDMAETVSIGGVVVVVVLVVVLLVWL